MNVAQHVAGSETFIRVQDLFHLFSELSDRKRLFQYAVFRRVERRTFNKARATTRHRTKFERTI
jgi:hypothetical protein